MNNLLKSVVFLLAICFFVMPVVALNPQPDPPSGELQKAKATSAAPGQPTQPVQPSQQSKGVIINYEELKKYKSLDDLYERHPELKQKNQKTDAEVINSMKIHRGKPIQSVPAWQHHRKLRP